MFRHQLVITLRTLWRDKGYTAINVLGLSVGIACGIIVALYIEDELGFDRMHGKADRIYRAVEMQNSAEKGERMVGTVMGPVGPALKSQIPQVENAVRLLSTRTVGRLAVGSGPNRVYDGDFYFAEASFLEMFDFPLISGDRKSALIEPRSVVLTESVAKRHFGDENPVGRELEVERFNTLKVTGVLQDPPQNSHLAFSMLISMSSALSNPNWLAWSNRPSSDGFLTYVLLRERTELGEISAPVRRVAESLADTQATTVRSFFLQPLTDVHFGSGSIEFDENQGKSDLSLLYIFAAIASFIVLIACVNYTNLATARSMRRAREVGIRKVSGADRSQLFAQFLGESLVLSVFAFLVALLIQEVSLPFFNQIAGKSLELRFPEHIDVLAVSLLLSGAIALLAGMYPAVVLSGFRPSAVLKGSLRTSRQGGLLRKGLVAFQFVISVGLIISTIVVYRHVGFVMHTELGFKRNEMVVVDINSGNARTNFSTMKNEFLTVPGVRKVSSTSRVPGEWKNVPEVEVQPTDGSISMPIAMTYFGVDEDFLDTYSIPLVDGRNFSRDFRADSQAVMLNEIAASLLGGRSVIGKEMVIPNTIFGGQRNPLGMLVRVVGIVKDYHYRPLYEPVGPVILGYWYNPVQAIDYFTISVEGRSSSELIPLFRNIGEKYDPTHPFEFNILEDRWADFYAAEERAGNVFNLASVISVVISCLGLFGLAAYSTEQRTKEVGIRKVLGATSSGIVAHLSREFLLLVLLGNAIAWPVAYYAMSRWLDDFAYRTDIGIDIFLIAGSVSVFIAFLSVAYKATRAAVANPVESLRYE